MGKTDISNLVADIYSVLGSLETTEGLEELTTQFGISLSSMMSERLLKRERGTGLRLSNIGRPDRQLWYDVNWTGEVEEFQPSTFIKFAYGDLIEHLIVYLIKAAGYEVEDEQIDLELEGVPGHPDFRIGNCVIDVKSASSYSFEKFRSGLLLEDGNDPFGYVGQLAGYVEAINPEADGAFLVVDKTLGKVCLLKMPNEVLKQYMVRDRIKHIKEVVSAPEPPPRCYEPKPEGKSGNFVLATGCSYCNHKLHCWADANGGAGLRTFIYSNGPKFFTHVEREPRVVEGGEF